MDAVQHSVPVTNQTSQTLENHKYKAKKIIKIWIQSLFPN
jgi:hypothetical protein